ncbi:branched-chain amino acid ABC transporter permease [Halorubrum distributum]|uniref:branched-chain amino acid ABC transporter permease n=1 Tax=Halorubrum distributum TaxID=29283 RepID=UPI0029545115|nr:branched-chain amino acid ABC transporter permease [Halorubrum distributum]MDV7348671.1 branched-chain amino acid ABC transporter permease [Halorubrum distributum]
MTPGTLPALVDAAALASAVDPTTLLATGGAVDGLRTAARVLAEGIGKGAVYFTIAVGLTLVFGLMGVLNFAHGAVAMVGAYLGGLVLVLVVGANTGTVATILVFFVALALVFAVTTAAGSAMEVALIRPIYDRTPTYQILLTFGVSLIIEEVARIVLTLRGIQPDPQWQAPMATAPDVLLGRTQLLGIGVRRLYLFEVAIGALVAVAVWAFLTKTLYGLYIRAGSEDTEMVQALGVDVRQAFTVVFGVGTGLAAVGGVLLMWDPIWGPSVLLSIDVLLYAFVVVIIGGLGSFTGTLVAAGIVGIADSVTTWLFTTGIVAFPGLSEVTIFLLLVVMLIIRPQGLYGVEEVGGH